jgi:hypothetical protein
VPGRLLAIVGAVFALALVCAGSAAAVSLTFDGEVLRYRESDSTTRAGLSADPIDGWPTMQLQLRFSTSPRPGRDTILGCAGDQLPGPLGREEEPSGTWNLNCLHVDVSESALVGSGGHVPARVDRATV